jgi:hypothetical protein
VVSDLATGVTCLSVSNQILVEHLAGDQLSNVGHIELADMEDDGQRGPSWMGSHLYFQLYYRIPSRLLRALHFHDPCDLLDSDTLIAILDVPATMTLHAPILMRLVMDGFVVAGLRSG